MTHIRPPAFAGLKWYRQDDQWCATFTRVYSAIWIVDFAVLQPLGFDTLRDYASYYSTATFDPNAADPEAVEAALHALMIKRADVIEKIEGPARRRAEKAQRLADAAARAPQVYDSYGPACVKSQTMALYMMRQTAGDMMRQTAGDEIDLGKLVLATEAKAAVYEAEARDRQNEPAPASTAAFSDEMVERSIRALTELDADHAEEANAAGWSRATTLGGHVCNRLLDTDRPLALAEGRRLISKHLIQLAKLGVVDWSSVPAKERAA